MRMPAVQGLIDRRILVNFRVDPSVLASLLPAPFRPKRTRGVGLVGICLIRLKHIRPAFLPPGIGLSSENAAHRIAVEWDEAGVTHEGVFVWRRDTNSRLNAWAGGRLFPGFQHRATFAVEETADRYSVALRSDDGATSVSVRGQTTNHLPATSVFASLEEASAFFQGGALGYSATPEPTRFQGLELRCFDWQVEPLLVEEVHSNFFEDETRFPASSIELDSGLLMRGVEHEWRSAPDLYCAAPDTRANQTPQSTRF